MDARYVPSGHLVFLRRGVLLAVAFDSRRLEIGGEPMPLLEDIGQALVGNTANMTGAGQLAVSSAGSLAYVAGGAPSYQDCRLTAVDHHGRVTQLSAPPRPYARCLRLSPDGQRLAVVVRGITSRGLWLYDMTRGTLTRLTRHGEVLYPAWSPGGERLAFTWLNDGTEQLAWQRADGSSRALSTDAGGWSLSSLVP